LSLIGYSSPSGLNRTVLGFGIGQGPRLGAKAFANGVTDKCNPLGQSVGERLPESRSVARNPRESRVAGSHEYLALQSAASAMLRIA
jgi:hypothetical protein